MSATTPDQKPADESGWYANEVQPHRPALKSWLQVRFPWLADVDDLVQEAAFRLWRRKTKVDGEALRSPKAALYAIARNMALDQARRNAIATIDFVADIERLPVLDSADVVETVSTRQELEFLADALRALPTRCRQVMTLTKIYGFTEREVAERLGISENTVRTQVVRGIERCTEYLREHGVNRDPS